MRLSPRIAVVPLLVLATFVAVPRAFAARAPIHTGARHDTVQVADGVTTWRQTIHVHDPKGWHKVHAVLMRMHTAVAGVRLDAGSPGSIVGETRTSVKAQADATHAIGGINADFFSWETSAAVPRGALIIGGTVLKTPRPEWDANFYVRADGSAAIGALPFTGLLTRKPRAAGDPVKTHAIASINTLADADGGRITLVNHGLAAAPIRRACTVAQGSTVAGHRVIASVTKGHSKLRRPAIAHWALVACGSAGGKFLNHKLKAGDKVKTAIDFTNGAPLAAVSGARVLVANGKTFDDVGGEVLGPGPNPETFACASKTGTSVLLGVVDGRSTSSFGVTFAQLTHYLRALKCWSGMVFDGGGSSILVAQLPGQSTTTVRNVPSDGRLREVADGIFVYAG